MREQEMRMRIFRFLKARMRNMIMPATVGIGLTVGGCAKSSSMYGAQIPQDAPPAHTDVLGPDSRAPGSDQAAPGPDLAVGERDSQGLVEVPADLARDLLSDPVPVYGDGFGVDLRKPDASDSSTSDVAEPTDQGIAIDGAVTDGNKDLGSITKYGVVIPPDSAIDAGFAPVYTAPLYSALTPDAGIGTDGLAVRYMAQMPDA